MSDIPSYLTGRPVGYGGSLRLAWSNNGKNNENIL